MAIRKPLVLVNGEVQQLQSGDSISVPFSETLTVVQTNNETLSVVIGTPVYNDVASGVKKAKADAAGTTKVLGLVNDSSITSASSGEIAIGGIMVATTGQWDVVTGGSGGLVVGTKYYLDAATAGLLTATAPSTVGQYVIEIGIALSTTDMKIDIKSRILL